MIFLNLDLEFWSRSLIVGCLLKIEWYHSNFFCRAGGVKLMEQFFQFRMSWNDPISKFYYQLC